VRCLLVQVRFSAFSFWNFVAACETMGASTPSPPLGLLTVAALLPQHWQFRLLDLNTRPFSEEDWAWADLVCVGGMLPQQAGMLAVIERARRDGKFVAVGGSDPTSQPDVYAAADARVLGEGESAIPVWLESWRAGEPRGVFREREKPDVTRTPVPRYDLLDFGCYAQIGVQYSRGCPFNCEFCDIIELFGRVPRTKTAEQLLGELDRLRELGYSGAVDIVDDNFIGNKRDVKRLLLPALIAWSERHGRPFFFTTEASMNLADDDELLGLMRAAGFRLVFMGIETPDPDLLRMTQKRQNTMRPIVERVRKLYDYGIVVTGGFIMGFDGEKRGADRAMVGLVEESGICLAMVGLLVALPTTQLTRRLVREGRLMDFTGKVVSTEAEAASSARAEGSMVEVVDQTARRAQLRHDARPAGDLRGVRVGRAHALRPAGLLRPRAAHRAGAGLERATLAVALGAEAQPARVLARQPGALRRPRDALAVLAQRGPPGPARADGARADDAHDGLLRSHPRPDPLSVRGARSPEGEPGRVARRAARRRAAGSSARAGRLSGCVDGLDQHIPHIPLPVPPRHRGPARAEGEVNDTDARLWHPWLRASTTSCT